MPSSDRASSALHSVTWLWESAVRAGHRRSESRFALRSRRPTAHPGSTFERCAIAAEERPTLSGHERRRSAPAGGKDKLIDRLTLTRLQFAFSQIIRKHRWIARISHGNHRHRLEARRNLTFPAGLFHIVPGHLMCLQSQAGRLENKVLDGHAGVMQGMPVWCSIVLKQQACNREDQD